MKISRGAFLRAGAAGLCGALAGVGYGTLYEPGRLTLERVSTRLRNLPAALEGFRIAVLSDFHLHPYTRIGLIEEAVAMANRLQPDLSVLLGDYVDADVEAIDELAPVLARLNPRLGIFGVLGNHDHWKGPRRVSLTLEKAGIRALVNAGVSLQHGGAELYLAGLDSAFAATPDAARALRSHRPGTPVIALIHEPDYADILALDPRFSLQLSGHSHGGQVRLPGHGAIHLPTKAKKYDYGLYQVRDLALYTNRGIGLAEVPVRINCPPEVTEITLLRA